MTGAGADCKAAPKGSLFCCLTEVVAVIVDIESEAKGSLMLALDGANG